MSYIGFEKSCHKKAENIFHLIYDESKSWCVTEGQNNF